MSYLAKKLINPVVGQYTITYPAVSAVVGHALTPTYYNGTSGFTDYCSVSGNNLILNPGNYLIECYVSATKNLGTSTATYKLQIDGVDAAAPKGIGYIGRTVEGASPDGFQCDINVPEGSTKSLKVIVSAKSGTITYIPQASTILIWRV